MKLLGVDYVIDYCEENVVEKVLELINGCGLDVVFDMVSVKNVMDFLDMIVYRGYLVYIVGVFDYIKVKFFIKVIFYYEVVLNVVYYIDDMIV